MKKCKKCGLILPDDAKFCRNCGSDLSVPENYLSVSEDGAEAEASEKKTVSDAAEKVNAENSGKKMKKCNKCGNLCSESESICSVCGNDLSDPANYSYSFENTQSEEKTAGDQPASEEQKEDTGSAAEVKPVGDAKTGDDPVASKEQKSSDEKKTDTKTGTTEKKDEKKPGNQQGNKPLPKPSGSSAGTAKSPRFWIITAIVVAALIGIISMIVALQPVTLKLNDYATVTYSGYDGYAKADVSIDSDKFYEDLYKAAVKKHKIKNDGSNLSLDSLYSDLSAFLTTDALSYDVDKSENLSNGDTITLTWNDSKNEFSSLKVKLDTSSLKTKVSGLESANVIDPFDEKFFNVDTDTKGVHIIVSGTSPMLTVEIQDNLDEAPYNDIQYSVDSGNSNNTSSWYGSSNYYFADGDEVTIKASFSNGTDKDTDNGNVLASTETQVKVQGDTKYVTDMSQITDASSLDQLRSDFKDYVESNLGVAGQKYDRYGSVYIYDLADDSEYHSDAVIDSYEFVTEYLSTVKDGYFSKTDGITADKYPASNSYHEPYNCLDAIYKVHFHNDKGEYDGYSIISLPDIKVDTNGKLVYTAKDFYNNSFGSCYDSADTAKSHIDSLKSYYTITEVNQSWSW